MKGISKIRPSHPRYSRTWDLSVVLNFLHSLGSNEKLTFKQLSQKLITLLALVTGHRIQTLSLIRIAKITETASGIQIFISDKIKTIGTNSLQPCLHLLIYDENPQICASSTLKAYIEATQIFKKPEQVFLPYTPKTTQTGK